MSVAWPVCAVEDLLAGGGISVSCSRSAVVAGIVDSDVHAQREWRVRVEPLSCSCRVGARLRGSMPQLAVGVHWQQTMSHRKPLTCSPCVELSCACRLPWVC